MTASLTSPELVTLAVYFLAPDGSRVDTEDVAVMARDLDSARFSWRKHPDQINLELVRVALSDAKKGEHGTLLTGSGNEGWSLTPGGVAFCAANHTRLETTPRTRQPHPRDRLWTKREKARMLATRAYELFSLGRVNEVTPELAAGFFHLDEYIRGKARDRKIARLRVAFAEDRELAEAITEVGRRLHGS